MIDWAEFCSHIDAGKIRKIGIDYGIEYEVLADELPWIGMCVSANMKLRIQEPDAEEVKRHITGMRNAAAVLNKKMKSLNALSRYHGELRSRYKKFYQLNNDLLELIIVLDELDPSGWKSKNSVTEANNSLIYQLAKIWKQQTGKHATGSGKKGEFIEFMCDCADVLGFDPEPLPARFGHLRRKNKGTDFEI
jgi:hypothetical protein